MKKVLTYGSLLLMSAFLFFSCGKDPKIEQVAAGDDEGRFSLTLGTAGSFEIVSKAETAEVDVKEFTVRIFGKTLKETAYDSVWARYADMPSVVTIPAGKYTIEAHNGEQKSGFEKPYFYGKKEFSVGIQELTDAQVICQLACVKVSVEFTSLFMDNVNDPSCLISQTDGVSLEFEPADDGRAGFIAAPADSTLAVTIRGSYKEDGTAIDRTYFIHDVGTRQWHKIALSVNTSAGIENGGNMVQVDHSVDEKESTVLVPGSGDLIDNNGDSGTWEDGGDPGKEDPDPTPGVDANAPQVTGVGFDIDEVLVKSAANDNLLDVNIKTLTGTIDSLVVTIESPALSGAALAFVGLAEKFDIANPESAMESSLKELGLIDPASPIKGKTEHTFSIGSFLSLLGQLDGGIGEVHRFHLRVVDSERHITEKTLTIKLTE